MCGFTPTDELVFAKQALKNAKRGHLGETGTNVNRFVIYRDRAKRYAGEG